ncbi:hypothetical protein [Schlesneria sp.]|uniref:hypothetical protein n=1 Tax=Schlesneria sp. TaxID=2762018 RepID=UPI002EE78207
MDSAFPFGFPVATAFYLVLYVLTFVLHQAFMHYVLAGSLCLTWFTISQRRETVGWARQPLLATLREWIPFLLSAAITAGVAPLLFIQIVYQHQFYTANLLLWWRWMIVVPVLIVGFYLTYLVKSQRLWTWPYLVRVAVLLVTSACFVFVGFCWTANHLIANRGATWPEVYTTGQLPFTYTEVIVRMLVWLAGSFPTMCVILGWQLFYRERVSRDGAQNESGQDAWGTRALSRMAIGGLAVSVLAGATYILVIETSAKGLVFGNVGRPYLMMGALGVGLQIGGWISMFRQNRLSLLLLGFVSAGSLTTLVCISVLREAVRLSAVDLLSLADLHAKAAEVGGFGVFLLAAVVVSLLIVWCIQLVRTGTTTSNA